MIFNHEGDTALIKQLLKGNKEAFARIYDIYFPILFQYCIRFTPDRSLIKDVLQDFFIVLLSRQKGLPESHDLKFYLLFPARRELVRRLAKDSRLSLEASTGESYEFHLNLAPQHPLL